MDNKPGFRCGMVVLVGRANVGKSTLVNAMAGQKICIVTPKPQTTRDAIQGIINRPEGQIVLVDTPGIFKTTSNTLSDRLHGRVREALEDIDVVVHVVDPSRAPGEEEEMVLRLLRRIEQPRILCLNKSDLPERPHRDYWLQRADQYAAWVEVSALHPTTVEPLIELLLQHLPEGPALHPIDQITNVTREFWLAEIIREKIYLLTGEEMPYHTRVQVEQIQERKARDGSPLVAVKAVILTDNDRRQRMLIGAGGRKVGEIGKAARADMETALGKKVFLDLAVLVDKNLLRNC